MSDPTTNADGAQNGISEPTQRDVMIDGPTAGSGRGRFLAGVAVSALIAVAAYVIVVQSGPDTTSPGTSQSADIQNPEGSSGVDTNMLGDGAVETAADVPVQGQMPAAEPVLADTGDADRISELERELAAMRATQGDDPDLATLLQQERNAMDDQRARELALAEQNYQLQLAALNQGGTTGMTEDERDARARLEEERQRRAAIAEAQVMSDGIVIDSSTAQGGGDAQAADGNGSGRQLSSNEAFMQEASTRSYETVRATRIANPGRTIVQGTTLNAVLETAISTELPGVIRAVVTDDVMSYDGMNVLLPQGTRLIGSYNSDVSVIQDRVQMAWNRAVTPDGMSVELGGYGADALGMSGQAGQVDARFRQRFGTAALISLIGAGPEVVIDENSGGAASDAAGDVGDDLSTATQGALDDYLSAGPVIYIDQGTYMTVIVNRDLVL